MEGVFRIRTVWEDSRGLEGVRHEQGRGGTGTDQRWPPAGSLNSLSPP